MPNLRQDQWVIKCAVSGVNPPAIRSWQGMSGGDPTSEDTKTRPGGGLPQISLGGPTTRSDATVTRLQTTGLIPYEMQWEQAIGASMWISYTPIDSTGTTNGSTTTLHGILKGVTRTEKNADTQGKATVSLVMSCHANASISQ